MNTTLKKTFSDLLANPGRSALVIFALVIGLWGLGSILVSYAILKNDLNENFTRTHPAHVTVTAEQFERLDLAVFRNRPEIESAAVPYDRDGRTKEKASPAPATVFE